MIPGRPMDLGAGGSRNGRTEWIGAARRWYCAERTKIEQWIPSLLPPSAISWVDCDSGVAVTYAAAAKATEDEF